MWFLIFWVVVFTVALVLYHRQLYSKFRDTGVKYATPVPLLGNMAGVTLGLEHFTGYLKRVYDKFPNDRFIGHFEFTSPLIFIRDLELAKKITIKDFEHFLDHRTTVDTKVDPFWGRSLFSLKGYEWRDMRSTLSPAFTSSKIRLMVPFMTEVSSRMIESVKEQIKDSGQISATIDSKDLMSRYANDVIASCAFGLKVDSQSEPENTFYVMGKEASTFKFKQILVFFAYSSFPKLMSFFKISVFSEATRKFFKALISSTMREREEQNIVRPDMIHLLLQAKKGQLSYDDKLKDTAVGFATVEESTIGKEKSKAEWTEDDLIAQTLIFLLGGFETVSALMSFALHEVAINTEVQDKLVKEIKEYNTKNNGKLDYNTLQSMQYMDMVVSEILRLWTPGFMLDRVCIKDYNLGKPNDDAKEDYIIRKGEGVVIPVWAFHRNPDFFPNPDKFDPERFSEENRHDFKSSAYLPFGSGPRNCIGSRFALCEVKAVLYHVLLHLEISPSKSTIIPIQLNRRDFNPRIKNGHSLNFKIRV